MARPKGSTNTLSRRVKIHIGQLIEDNFQDLEQEIKELKGKQKVDALLTLISYIVPKQKSTTTDIETRSWNEDHEIPEYNFNMDLE